MVIAMKSLQKERKEVLYKFPWPLNRKDAHFAIIHYVEEMSFPNGLGDFFEAVSHTVNGQ